MEAVALNTSNTSNKLDFKITVTWGPVFTSSAETLETLIQAQRPETMSSPAQGEGDQKKMSSTQSRVGQCWYRDRTVHELLRAKKHRVKLTQQHIYCLYLTFQSFAVSKIQSVCKYCYQLLLLLFLLSSPSSFSSSTLTVFSRLTMYFCTLIYYFFVLL